MCHMGGLHPKGGPFSGWGYEGAGISLVEVNETVGESVIVVCGRT